MEEFHVVRQPHKVRTPVYLPIPFISLSNCAHMVGRHPVHMHIGEPIDLKQFAEPNEAIEAVRNAVIEGRMKNEK